MQEVKAQEVHWLSAVSLFFLFSFIIISVWWARRPWQIGVLIVLCQILCRKKIHIFLTTLTAMPWKMRRILNVGKINLMISLFWCFFIVKVGFGKSVSCLQLTVWMLRGIHIVVQLWGCLLLLCLTLLACKCMLVFLYQQLKLRLIITWAISFEGTERSFAEPNLIKIGFLVKSQISFNLATGRGYNIWYYLAAFSARCT